MTTSDGGLQHSCSSAFQAYSPPECRPGNGLHTDGPSRKLVDDLTVSLVKTYQGCSSAFRYCSKLAPRRLLTKPAEPASNSGWDNASHDLIVAVGDEFVSTLGSKYVVRDLLGQGTFGQVFKCVNVEDEDDSDAIAIKVVKNQAAYYHQARVEIGVLQYLNTRADPGDKHHIVRLKDFFLYRNHLCLAFELLSLNLYELIRHNKFRGLSLSLVRVFISQILQSMVVLRDSRIIHCDLKPENVLLKNVESGEVKVIDFGSACFESRTVYSYIQSRFYRSPEVVLGFPYAMSIDMWSLGCVAAELFLGLPLFPGACEHDLLGRIISTLGPLPDILLTGGKNSLKYFSVQEELLQDPLTGDQLVRQRFLLRTQKQFEELTGQPAPTGKQYFQHSALGDIIGAYPVRSGLSDEEVARERRLRESFTNFLLGVLDVNPATRWTPRQAARHPFITGERFTAPFQPLPDISVSPAVATPAGSSRSGAGLGPQQQQQHPPQRQQQPRPMQQQVHPLHQQQQQQQPKALHTPGMQIPMASAATRQQQAATIAAGEKQQQQQQQSGAAASPWAQAAAHAAAVAAVQAQYGSYQQQYSAAHSLQNIVGANAAAAGMAHLAGGYGAAAMQTTPRAQQSHSSSYAPLLSPPSRSFRTQLHYADYGSSLLQQQMASVDGLHGVMPLLQTPTSASQQPTLSPGSFQPSSISTYHAALAAAQSAMHQQAAAGLLPASSSYQQQQQYLAQHMAQQHAQQQQQQHLGSYSQQHIGSFSQQQAAAAAAFAASSAGMPGSSWGHSWQQQQHQLAGSLPGLSPAHAAAAAAAIAAAAASIGGMQGGAHAAYAAAAGRPIAAAGMGAHAHPPASMPQVHLYRGGMQGAGAAAAAAGGGGSRWTSMDGSSPGGTPPLDGLGGNASTEDVPNPADFDPLWSDALLEEEEEEQQQQLELAQQKQQQLRHDNAPHAKRQHVQAPEQQQQQQVLPSQAMHQREPSLSIMLPAQQQQQQQSRALDAAAAAVGSLGQSLSLGPALGGGAAAAAGIQLLQQPLLAAQQQGLSSLARATSLEQQRQQPASRQAPPHLQQQQQQQHGNQRLQQLRVAQQQVNSSMQRAHSLQQQQQQQQPAAALPFAAPGSIGVTSGSDPLALAAQCLPQLQQLQQQQQLSAGGRAAMPGSAFAFQSPVGGQQQQALVQAQLHVQQQQADVASMLSAFGRAAAAVAAADGGPPGSSATGGSDDSQKQLLLLQQALSLGGQNSTTLTDGFANYTLQDGPAAAAAAVAAVALAQQHSVNQELGEQQQQQALLLYGQRQQELTEQQQAQQHALLLFSQQQQQQRDEEAAMLLSVAGGDGAASMLWSPAAAPQLLQAVQQPSELLLGPPQMQQPQQQQQQQQAAQYFQQQPHVQQPQHQPLQRQQGFDL